MPFVKLDTKILDSTLWVDREAREVFITALLMAIPVAYDEPVTTYKIDSLDEDPWSIPPGEYGLVEAAGVGIIRRAMIEEMAGMEALERLASPELISRSSDFDGRRLVRVDGGFVVLNFIKYREKDHTAAERQRRYRDRKRNAERQQGNGVTLRNITQAEAEAEAEAEADKKTKGPPVPHQAIVDLYHEHCPALPRVKVLNKKRKAQLNSRWKTFEAVRGIGKPGESTELIKFDNLDTWKRYFTFITEQCPFMLGNNDQNWVANFDFCIRESGMVNVMENKYVERKKK